jgi:membrane-associated protease RseP (regulator of RpoE activity)
MTRRARFDGASIAGFDLPPMLFSIPMSEGHGAMAEKSLIGNLGSNVFRHFVIYLDYDRQQIIFEKGDDFGKAFPIDNSGIQIWYPGGEKRMEIRFVAPGTAGEKAGLLVDDRILAVNGIPVEQLDGLHAFRELMQAPSGTAYDLTVEREGSELKVNLVLEDAHR